MLNLFFKYLIFAIYYVYFGTVVYKKGAKKSFYPEKNVPLSCLLIATGINFIF